MPRCAWSSTRKPMPITAARVASFQARLFMGILSQSFKKHSPWSRLAARKRDFGRKEISESGKLGKTTSGRQTGYVQGFYRSVFSTLPMGPALPFLRLFWLSWGAKKRGLFLGGGKKSRTRSEGSGQRAEGCKK